MIKWSSAFRRAEDCRPSVQHLHTMRKFVIFYFVLLLKLRLFFSETQISFTEDATDEEISETIRAHKNIITNIREQHLPMGRKLKVLNRSKNFLKRHEGELKQSKQAKDLFAKYKVYYERVNSLVVCFVLFYLTCSATDLSCFVLFVIPGTVHKSYQTRTRKSDCRYHTVGNAHQKD